MAGSVRLDHAVSHNTTFHTGTEEVLSIVRVSPAVPLLFNPQEVADIVRPTHDVPYRALAFNPFPRCR